MYFPSNTCINNKIHYFYSDNKTYFMFLKSLYSFKKKTNMVLRPGDGGRLPIWAAKGLEYIFKPV